MRRSKRYKYKVIKKETRFSAIISGNSKYALRYLKGTRVWALPKTLGVMVFDTKTRAENFTLYDGENALIIVRVLPYGMGKRPSRISGGIYTNDMDIFYGKNTRWFSSSPPLGTICYKGVYVVD